MTYSTPFSTAKWYPFACLLFDLSKSIIFKNPKLIIHHLPTKRQTPLNLYKNYFHTKPPRNCNIYTVYYPLNYTIVYRN